MTPWQELNLWPKFPGWQWEWQTTNPTRLRVDRMVHHAGGRKGAGSPGVGKGPGPGTRTRVDFVRGGGQGLAIRR
jgi:hypothetical protein